MDFEQYEPLRNALIGYYASGKSGKIKDHLPIGAEMVDSRYIVYKNRRERLDLWCRMLDVYNAPYNVKGNYQTRVKSLNSRNVVTTSAKKGHRPLASYSNDELVTLAQKISERFNKAIEEAKKIGDEFGISIQVSESNILDSVYAKLKERRDTVTKESVERELQTAIGKLSLKGDYTKVTELTTLFTAGQYKEVRNKLNELS